MKRLLMTLLLLLTVTLTQAQLTSQLTTTFDQNDQISEFDDMPLLASTTSFETKQSHKLNLNMNMSMRPTKERNSGGDLALGLLAGGAAFIIGGLTSKVPYEGYNGPNKPFFQQGPRMYAIMGGSLLMGAGLVISIP